jgi:uncharacterized membrane protein
MLGASSSKPRDIALTAVMTAATAAVTMVLSIPFPPTRGYFNLGDAMVMLAGLLFGARLGGIAGGVGSAISDVLLGYGYFAPLTLLIKGTEGLLTGLIGNNKKLSYKVAGVIAGAIAMLVGYFSVETPLYGIGPALAELLTINSLQVGSGAIVSLIICQAILRAYPDIKFLQPRGIGLKAGVIAVVVAAVVLAAIVGAYLMSGISP